MLQVLNRMLRNSLDPPPTHISPARTYHHQPLARVNGCCCCCCFLQRRDEVTPSFLLYTRRSLLGSTCTPAPSSPLKIPNRSAQLFLLSIPALLTETISRATTSLCFCCRTIVSLADTLDPEVVRVHETPVGRRKRLRRRRLRIHLADMITRRPAPRTNVMLGAP